MSLTAARPLRVSNRLRPREMSFRTAKTINEAKTPTAAARNGLCRAYRARSWTVFRPCRKGGILVAQSETPIPNTAACRARLGREDSNPNDVFTAVVLVEPAHAAYPRAAISFTSFEVRESSAILSLLDSWSKTPIDLPLTEKSISMTVNAAIGATTMARKPYSCSRKRLRLTAPSHSALSK